MLTRCIFMTKAERSVSMQGHLQPRCLSKAKSLSRKLQNGLLISKLQRRNLKTDPVSLRKRIEYFPSTLRGNVRKRNNPWHQKSLGAALTHRVNYMISRKTSLLLKTSVLKYFRPLRAAFSDYSV